VIAELETELDFLRRAARYLQEELEASKEGRRTIQDTAWKSWPMTVKVLKYRAKNEPPYLFEWVNQKDTTQSYIAGTHAHKQRVPEEVLVPLLGALVVLGRPCRAQATTLDSSFSEPLKTISTVPDLVGNAVSVCHFSIHGQVHVCDIGEWSLRRILHQAPGNAWHSGLELGNRVSISGNHKAHRRWIGQLIFRLGRQGVGRRYTDFRRFPVVHYFCGDFASVNREYRKGCYSLERRGVIQSPSHFKENSSPLRSDQVIGLLKRRPRHHLGSIGLPKYEHECGETNPNRPPFGPFDGCVPIKSFFVGPGGLLLGVAVVAGEVYVNRFTISFVSWLILVAGSFVWLTGHTDCENSGKRQDFPHDAENVSPSDPAVPHIELSFTNGQPAQRLRESAQMPGRVYSLRHQPVS
jgi:hypothetical protein